MVWIKTFKGINKELERFKKYREPEILREDKENDNFWNLKRNKNHNTIMNLLKIESSIDIGMNRALIKLICRQKRYKIVIILYKGTA